VANKAKYAHCCQEEHKIAIKTCGLYTYNAHKCMHFNKVKDSNIYVHVQNPSTPTQDAYLSTEGINATIIRYRIRSKSNDSRLRNLRKMMSKDLEKNNMA
jgi:hypothetical protein